MSIFCATAHFIVQEANEIAVVGLAKAKIGELRPIGFSDRSRKGFALDALDKDDGINIHNYNFLYGMQQPYTISTYVASDNEAYLVFTNAGDAIDSEEARGADITGSLKPGRNAVLG